MGFEEEDVAHIIKIQQQAIVELKNLEAKHAQLKTDDEGEYFDIPPFEKDRQSWMTQIANELRSIADDDRAVVISRLIAQSDNDEETGRYHRHIRALPPKKPGADVIIQESVFDEKGGLIDQDYSIYRGEQESRWDHLFNPQ